MKKRKGFVSNSSSSSFVINFGPKPETKEGLAKVMGDCRPLNTCGSFQLTTDEVVSFVWKEIKDQDPDQSSVTTCLANLGIDLDCEYSIKECLFEGISEKVQNAHWSNVGYTKDMLMKDIELRFNSILKKPSVDGEDDFVTTISIGDDCDYTSQLEHGNIFRNCKRVERFSNH